MICSFGTAIYLARVEKICSEAVFVFKIRSSTACGIDSRKCTRGNYFSVFVVSLHHTRSKVKNESYGGNIVSYFRNGIIGSISKIEHSVNDSCKFDLAVRRNCRTAYGMFARNSELKVGQLRLAIL